MTNLLLAGRTFALAMLAAIHFAVGSSGAARAHFSYSDPRVIHVAEQDDGRAVVLIRMPAPLALLPEDWRGQADTRVPPFGVALGDGIVLDRSAVVDGDAALRTLLNDGLALWVGGRRAETRVDQVRFWSDNDRPRFGTLKTARAAFDAPVDPSGTAQNSYFDLTLDVWMTVPSVELADDLRLESQLGHRFRVIEKLGTVVKLHRNDATETRPVLGVLDVSFPGVATQWDILRDAALSGAEHIYRGLDHLAIILLIALAAPGWRTALLWASAFTVGHMVTLVAGLYGVAPASTWFVPMVELAIVVSIAVAGIVVCLRRDTSLGWTGLMIVGLIHGYGFAASASEALFAGEIDPLNLAAFALGLELCQFAIYALALPLVMLADKALAPKRVGWRRPVALAIALFAAAAAVPRLSEASAAFGVV